MPNRLGPLTPRSPSKPGSKRLAIERRSGGLRPCDVRCRFCFTSWRISSNETRHPVSGLRFDLVAFWGRHPCWRWPSPARHPTHKCVSLFKTIAECGDRGTWTFLTAWVERAPPEALWLERFRNALSQRIGVYVESLNGSYCLLIMYVLTVDVICPYG